MNDAPFVTKTVSGAEELARLRALEPIPLTGAELEVLRNYRNVFGEHRLKRMAQRKGRNKTGHDGYRPRQSTVQKRLRVLEAATLLWAEQGMSGHSVRALAQQAGVAATTVNYVLGNRHELLAEILGEHVAALSSRVYAAMDASVAAAPAVRLEALLMAYLEGVAAAPHAHFLLQHALSSLAPRGREVVRSCYRNLLSLLGEPLVQLVPEAKGSLAAALALAALGAVGDALLWFEPAEGMAVPTTARRLATMLLAAVGSEVGAGPRLGCGGPIQACARGWLAGSRCNTWQVVPYSELKEGAGGRNRDDLRSAVR